MKRSAAVTFFFAILLYCLPLFAGDIIHISTLEKLQDIRQDDPYNHYILDNDIDATETATWNGGAGFVPIGIPGNPFLGVFDGNGFVIKRLTINRPNEDYVGLFGVVRGATIRNVGLTECNITGQSNVGALLGAGGNSEKLDKCYSSGSVTATGGPAGGLAGSNSAYIKQSYSSANVTAQNGDRIGGLIGDAVFISSCYSTGDVLGRDNVGGLSGTAMSITDSYSTGKVIGNSTVGGLVGFVIPADITNCYSTGMVTGNSEVGGLVGDKDTTATSSYWDTETSGQTISPAGEGKTTPQMKRKTTFSGWDFDTIWNINEGVSYPYFRPFAEACPGCPPPTVPAMNLWGLLVFAILLAVSYAGLIRRRKPHSIRRLGPPSIRD